MSWKIRIRFLVFWALSMVFSVYVDLVCKHSGGTIYFKTGRRVLTAGYVYLCHNFLAPLLILMKRNSTELWYNNHYGIDHHIWALAGFSSDDLCQCSPGTCGNEFI